MLRSAAHGAAPALRGVALAIALAGSWALPPVAAQQPAAATAPQPAVPPAVREAAPASADPALEARVNAIAAELRCLVCQNQTIADSHAELANDLRRQIREMLTAGKTDADVLAYMTERYGDFVLYRPPVKTTTALLWAGPAIMLVLGVGVLIFVLRRRQRLADDAFEPDAGDDDERADVPPAPTREPHAAERPAVPR